MSRVDEALRRAAEQAAAAERAAAGAAGTNGAAASVVDTFPDEIVPEQPQPPMPEPRAAIPPPPQPSIVADAAADDAEPAADVEPETPREDTRRRRSRGSIFDRIDSRLTEKVVTDQNMMPASREQYRRLAAVLHDAQGTKGLKVIMIVSATAGEG